MQYYSLEFAKVWAQSVPIWFLRKYKLKYEYLYPAPYGKIAHDKVRMNYSCLDSAYNKIAISIWNDNEQKRTNTMNFAKEL